MNSGGHGSTSGEPEEQSDVRVIEHQTFRLGDGCAIAAKLWLPKDASSEPVPAILEILPYRKRDSMSFVDSMIYPYYAARGYVCIRADLRGGGESEGTYSDYLQPFEVDDALELISLIAREPWCDGSVGVTGLSWGGMNALRIAARSPKEVKAAISICASDDRYGTDVHYMGGCLLHESLAWSTLLQAEFCRPPDPALVGDAWREMWLERLNHERPPMATWLEHQRRDTYWTEEVASENYGGVTCPMLVVGGWFDGYVNTVLRLMERISCPRKAIIGPWQHIVPHFDWTRPGPAIGFLKESTRWWDRWLKGIETGVENEPMVRAWIYDTLPTKPFFQDAPGRWVAEQTWPTDRITPRIFNLAQGHALTESRGASATYTVSSPQDTGLLGGLWLPEYDGPDLGLEQRADDGKSLVLDSEPLTEAIEILGSPKVQLRLSADVPQAMVVARICDVSRDQASRRVSYGMLNLSHRGGSAAPESLVPDQDYVVELRMKDVGYRFETGHVIRLAISTSYWPMAWPAPQRFTLSVKSEDSIVTLPLRLAEGGPPDPTFGHPERLTPVPITTLRDQDYSVEVTRDLGAGSTRVRMAKDTGSCRRDDLDLVYDLAGDEVYSIHDDDPLSATAVNSWVGTMARGDWQIRVENSTRLTSDERNFHLSAELRAYEADQEVVSRSWSFTIPRDHL